MRATRYLAAAFFIVGLLVGLLVGRFSSGSVSAAEFDAAGSVVAAAGTIGALIFGFITYRRDRSERDATELRGFREQARLDARAARDAQLVTARALPASTSGAGPEPGTAMMVTLRLQVDNHSAHEVSNVLFDHPFSNGSVRIVQVAPGAREFNDETVSPTPVPHDYPDRAPQDEVFRQGLTMTFDLHSRSWRWDPVNGSVPQQFLSS